MSFHSNAVVLDCDIAAQSFFTLVPALLRDDVTAKHDQKAERKEAVTAIRRRRPGFRPRDQSVAIEG